MLLLPPKHVLEQIFISNSWQGFDKIMAFSAGYQTVKCSEDVLRKHMQSSLNSYWEYAPGHRVPMEMTQECVVCDIMAASKRVVDILGN